MDEAKMIELAEGVLGAWNTQDVDEVAGCYTDDVVYLDPNTRGYVNGSDAFKKYLGKLFEGWRMTWAYKEGFIHEGGAGCTVLWHATIRKHDGEKVVEFDGMDLVLVRDDRIARNEVYFDRTALMALFQDA
ncbi:MAG: nuclear transport factor 2 family protein [Candidatus Geothermincolia bacterium]